MPDTGEPTGSQATGAPQVRHNPAARRFEADVTGGLAHADYDLQGTVMRIFHTEVPTSAAGQGVAGHVVKAALEYARGHGLSVLPRCAYVAAYMRDRPATHDLFPPGVAV